MTLFCRIAIVLLALSAGAARADGELSPVPPELAAFDIVEEVIVEAPEPRYVAPTLRDRIGRIWAPVLINGQGPFRLVLDTGATHSAIIPSVATILGIPPRESAVRLHGVTGSAMVPSILVQRLEVGDMLINGAMLPIVADVFGGAEGVLGNAGLADKRILIDFKRDRIEIIRSRNQRAGVGFSTIPLKFARDRLLMLEVRIGNVRTKAIIDTGAQQTIGNNALREMLITRAREMKTFDIIGVTLDVVQGEAMKSPPVSFGDVVVHGLHVTFGDMFIFEHWKLTKEPILLIGMDVLGLLEAMVIDYKTRELHVRPRR